MTREILEMRPDPESRDYVKLMGMRERIALGIQSVAARIDETQLRARTTDKLGELLAEIRRHREGPKTIEH